MIFRFSASDFAVYFMSNCDSLNTKIRCFSTKSLHISPECVLFVQTLTPLTSLRCFEKERIECSRPVNANVRDTNKLRQKTLVSEGAADVYLGKAKYRVRRKVVRF